MFMHAEQFCLSCEISADILYLLYKQREIKVVKCGSKPGRKELKTNLK